MTIYAPSDWTRVNRKSGIGSHSGFGRPRVESTLGARAATFASCVAMISVVFLSARRLTSKSTISAPVCESRLPVGSSARINPARSSTPGDGNALLLAAGKVRRGL